MLDWYDRHHILDFDSSVAMRYHSRRRSFLEFLSRLDPALTLILGGATFGTLVSGYPVIATYAAFATTAASAINLTFDTAARARKHDALFRSWADLRSDLALVPQEDDAMLRQLEVKRARLDGECPGQITVLSIICENEEKVQRETGPTCRVRWWQHLFSNWFTLPPWRFKPEKVVG